MEESKQEHWDVIYKNKNPEEVSWTQEFPTASVDLFEHCRLYQNDSIIDVGCGETGMIPYWTKRGLKNIIALDLSNEALDKLKGKLTDSSSVEFINSDVSDFKYNKKIAYWHDRAVFHFLIEEEQIANYVKKVNDMVSGYLSIATFSKNGPLKCSGLPICQYSSSELAVLFSEHFELVSSEEEVHKTPFDTKQAFTYCLFKRKSSVQEDNYIS